MTALTAGRNTPEAIGRHRKGAVAAGVEIFPGALLMRNAAGFVLPGATATGSVGVGRAQALVDNSGGANGDLEVDFVFGIFRYENSAAADEITAADIGALAYIVDDQTVAKTSATATRSPAGTIDDVDADGVWVRLDEALTQAAV